MLINCHYCISTLPIVKSLIHSNNIFKLNYSFLTHVYKIKNGFQLQLTKNKFDKQSFVEIC